MTKYDLIIIGAGPAGLTAGIYAARSGLKTAIISKDIGGTANSILNIENWPGYKGTGSKLMKDFYEHAKEYDIKFIMADVENVKKNGKTFIVKTKKEELESKALVVTTGTERRKLNIRGEKELLGKGVSHCVTCDAFFFKNKITAVIGGSDCAATSALALADISKKVYVFYRGEKLRCEEITSDKLDERKNVEIFYNSIPKEIVGENKVEGLLIEEKGKERKIEVDGVFIEVGAIPMTKCLEDLKLKLDAEKNIVVSEEMKTSVEGVFAAGDVTHHKLKQVVVASGQGAIAAKSAYDFLSRE